jgi:hypothetical protein
MSCRTLFTLLAMAPVALAGCGRGGGLTGPDADDRRAITELVNGIEGTNNPRAAARLFAQGSLPPPDRLRALARYSVTTSGSAKVSGDTATARIKLVENRTGQESGEVEWSFVKEAGAWKIKATPLP